MNELIQKDCWMLIFKQGKARLCNVLSSKESWHLNRMNPWHTTDLLSVYVFSDLLEHLHKQGFFSCFIHRHCAAWYSWPRVSFLWSTVVLIHKSQLRKCRSRVSGPSRRPSLKEARGIDGTPLRPGAKSRRVK